MELRKKMQTKESDDYYYPKKEDRSDKLKKEKEKDRDDVSVISHDA